MECLRPHNEQRAEGLTASRLGLICLCSMLALVLSACNKKTDDSTSHDQLGAYELVDSVAIQVSGINGENIKYGDYFSDTKKVWSGDRASQDGEEFGNFLVRLPVQIQVSDSQDDTLNIEDILGDNSFTWQRLELLRNDARQVGGDFEVEMPVVIRVSNSKRIKIDLEDVFGDNSFKWTVGLPSEADTTLEVGQLIGVGGPFRIDMSITIEVFDSEDIEIDVEDVLGDSQFTWVGGRRATSAFVGGSMDFDVPLSLRVERSDRVKINLEDTAGDMKFDWTVGESESLGSPISFDVTTSFIIDDSRDVNIDFEDQACDNICNWRVAGQNPMAPELSSSVSAVTPVEFRVTNSKRVKINSEDFFGDNRFVWASNFPQDARTGLDNSVSISAPVTFQVEISQDVNIDAEDVYGDNTFAWNPLDLGQASPLPASVHDVMGNVNRNEINSDSVTIEFANLNQGNQYLWGPPPN